MASYPYQQQQQQQQQQGLQNPAAYAQQQQQQALLRQQQAQAGYRAAAQQQQQVYPQQQAPPVPGHELQTDGNDGLRNAKRRKPTDRSLPSFRPAKPPTLPLAPTEEKLKGSTESLQIMSESYKKLQEVERKLDWNVSRRKVELAETLGPARAVGVKRTLRVHLSTTAFDQSWQLGDSLKDVPAPPESDAPGTGPVTAQQAEDAAAAASKDEESKVEGDATTVKPDFKTDKGVPRFELELTGEVLELTETETKKPLTAYITRAVVETDRDPSLYDKTGPIDWQRSAAIVPPPAGLLISLPTTSTTKVRLSLYLDHRPERFALAPKVASLLGMAQGDRVSVLQALWSYIKMHNLQADDKRHINTDARLKELFSGQDKVPFHHLPEYVNRFLAPSAPVVIEHTVRVDTDAGAKNHIAFDLELTVEDPARAEMERVSHILNTPSEKMKEIMALDEKIALDALSARTSYLKRTFLTSFASSPTTFLQKWVSSQSRDLDLILGGDRASQSSIGGGSTWREEVRHADVWEGEWVREGASVLSMRRQEKGIKDATAGLVQQQQMQQRGVPPAQMAGYAGQQGQYGTPQGYGRR
ncbi:hypothetical protein BCR35DRAFT_305438 [Leucosporidium creatinivorum]|uniref:DM2 domain-containing protein n=1 Tax=Leucosporidium creatinivorum TaxID=106004 RepID=A0A1Y2F2T7_9BASI|nr:hypothetical protein BCR35DRAFT_305438 [Leucosporidium creatinivorum]